MVVRRVLMTLTSSAVRQHHRLLDSATNSVMHIIIIMIIDWNRNVFFSHRTTQLFLVLLSYLVATCDRRRRRQ